MPPTPGLRGQVTSPGSPAGFLGSSGQCKRPPLLSCSSGLGGPLLPASPDLSGLPPMSPRTHEAWWGLWRAGDQPGSSAGSLGLGGRGKHPPLLSCSSRRAPPACLSCSPPTPPASFLCPQGPTWPGGGFGGQGTGLRAQQASWAEWVGQTPSSPLLLLPPSSPDLPGLRGTDPVWPQLLLPPQSPYVLLVHFGVHPVSLGVSVPHQRLAGALVVGRC